MIDWSALSAISGALATLIAAVALFKTIRLTERQILLGQRQLIVPVWSFLKELNDIDPSKPVWIDVIQAVNMLELIAISWEAQFMDLDIIRRMYGELFVEFFQKIQECRSPPPGMSKDGRQLLLASPSIIRLYQALLSEKTEGQRVQGLD
jgi:hypothetical protein